MPYDERDRRGGGPGGRRSYSLRGDSAHSLRDPRREADAASREDELTDFDRTSADIPIWGWLSGASGRAEAATREAEADRNRNYWETLNEFAPTRDDLGADLAYESEVAGPGSEWNVEDGSVYDNSMSRLEEWASGGLTDTDRAMMDETARGEAMGARADREAALSSLEARGAGSSGASLAADLAAGEGAASRASAANTSLLGAAQAREYNANAALGDMDARARSGREAYNMYDTDYYRGREDRNTDRENETRENDATAAQTEYQNRERATAGATNQYSTDAGGRERAGERDDERDQGLLASLGELFG